MIVRLLRLFSLKNMGKLKANVKEDMKKEKSNSVDAKSKSVKKAKSDGKEQKKSIGGSSKDTSVQSKKAANEPAKNKHGVIMFPDCPDFQPNLTPKEVLQAGSFGGTYFRPIYSSITKKSYNDVWKELPPDWIEGLNIKTQVASPNYRESVNKYGVKCGGSLQMWEESGWMRPQDPYGWFQWYCRFYQGRRTEDDERQIGRWSRCAGLKGRWRNNLISKIVRSEAAYTDRNISPVVRQTLLHWGYELTQADFEKGAKRVRK